MSARPELEETWAPGRTVPLRDILGALRRGTGDPTMVLDGRNVWWAITTPAGVAATWWRTVPASTSGDEVLLRAWGSGAAWLAGRWPTIIGADDESSCFTPHHDVVRRALRRARHADWRVPRTGLVTATLVPTILEQKVTGRQAFAGYRTLVRCFGTPCRLPDEVIAGAGQRARAVGHLHAPPTAEEWRRIPSWAWLQAGVEPAQSRTVMRALARPDVIERTAQMPLPQAHRTLRSVPGIGVWTAAKVAQTAWGDADAPTFADYHVATQIGHALVGRAVDDAGMHELLEPYRGHRFRAERIILIEGQHQERRGPRMNLPAHLPARW